MALRLRPISYREACAYIEQYHRHHKKPQGWKFGAAVYDGDKMVGVIMAGRPVSRMLDDGLTLEVTRCCTDGTSNACSMLYGAIRRAAKALGYDRVITYTLEDESGATLKAAGWKQVGRRGGGSWGREGRPREDNHPTVKKILWESN